MCFLGLTETNSYDHEQIIGVGMLWSDLFFFFYRALLKNPYCSRVGLFQPHRTFHAGVGERRQT